MLGASRTAAAARSIAGDPDHPANFGRSSARRARRSARRWRSTAGCCIRCCGSADGTLRARDWDDALDHVADGFKRIVERARARRGRVLSLRPAADRGLLRRQQADEGLHRLGQCRHQFAALHGVVGRRPSPRLRRRHRARHLRRSRRGRSDRAGRLQRRLVPSGAVPAHGAQQDASAAPRSSSIDPRRTATGDDADLFLPIAPGMDTALFCGLLVHLAETRRARSTTTSTRTPSGFDEALARAREIAPDVAATARATGLDDSAMCARFFELFRDHRRVVTCYSQGVNQSAQGTDKVNAIINCHLATGRIGKPGMGPFSLTGQPNAMGGREVGGLANQLAAHMGFSPAEVDRVRRFWNAPRMAEREGLKAVQMFEAIARGEIKALWVMATNPGGVAAARRRGARGARASSSCSSCPRTCSRTTPSTPARMCCCRPRPGARRTAPSPIPSAASRASARSCRCRARRKPDWWIVSRGRAAAWASPKRSPIASAADVFREHAALSAFENDGARDFRHRRPRRRYRTRTTTRSRRCNGRSRDRHGAGEPRFFADGGFFTPDRKARFIAPEPPALQRGDHRPNSRCGSTPAACATSGTP